MVLFIKLFPLYIKILFGYFFQNHYFDPRSQSYDPSYNAVGSLACFANKNILFYSEKNAPALYNAGVVAANS
jgi:hypothetical protein